MAENDGGEVQGFALWFLNYSTWEGVHGIYLEDLYVARRPAARATARPCCSIWPRPPSTRGYARVEWSVLDWNEPSINFYRNLGASRWRNGPLSG